MSGGPQPGVKCLDVGVGVRGVPRRDLCYSLAGNAFGGARRTLSTLNATVAGT